MADTRTTLNIEFKEDGATDLDKVLSNLLDKAQRIKDTLSNLNVGGGVGQTASSRGVSGGSSLSSSLPVAERAARGISDVAVSGGSSVESKYYAGLERREQIASLKTTEATREWEIEKENLLRRSLTAQDRATSSLDTRAQAANIRLESLDEEFERVDKVNMRRNFLRRAKQQDYLAELKSEFGGGNTLPQGQSSNRNRYIAAAVLGVISHSSIHAAGSIFGAYQGARPIETGAELSGDIFGYAQGMREAQAMRQLAWAKLPGQITTGFGGAMLSAGLVGVATGAMKLGTGAALGGIGTVASIAGDYWQQSWAADINQETTRRNMGFQRLQSMQQQSLDIARRQAALIPFGRTTAFEFDELAEMGRRRGYTYQESTDMLQRFYSSGGSYRNIYEGDLFENARYAGITPETSGSFMRGFLPGGGYGGTGYGGGDELNAARTALGLRGIGANRINESLSRVAGLGQRYAERGVVTDIGSLTGTVNAMDRNLRGNQALFGVENLQKFGMGLSDQLTEAMMPQRLAGALMMSRIIGEGGGPLDWSRKMQSPEKMRQLGASMESDLPEMMRPFFAGQLTGLVPDSATLRGKGLTRADIEGGRIVQEFRDAVSPAPKPDSLNVLVANAEAAAKTILDFDTTTRTLTKTLDLLTEAVQNAISVIPLLGGVVVGPPAVTVDSSRINRMGTAAMEGR